MELIEQIQSSAFATFVRESPSLFGYTLMLSLHAIGLSIVVGLNIVVAIRLLGISPGIPLRPLIKLFPVMYIGFWINALSGIALFAANASGMLGNVLFFVKLGLIACAVIVLRLIRNRVFGDASLEANHNVVPRIGRRLAVLSLIFWCSAIIVGRMTAYPYFIEAWFGI